MQMAGGTTETVQQTMLLNVFHYADYNNKIHKWICDNTCYVSELVPNASQTNRSKSQERKTNKQIHAAMNNMWTNILTNGTTIALWNS